MILSIQCLAAVIYLEARGEPIAGRIAVADTIMTRAALSGDTPCAERHRPNQYALGSEYDAASVVIAAAVYAGIGCRCVTHFHNAPVSPGWNMPMVKIIGGHTFYFEKGY